MVELLGDRIPDVRVTVIPDSAHLANVEQPEAFNRALLDFLA
jgi:pimeloyl-ACP methyl ester carboxylesterase